MESDPDPVLALRDLRTFGHESRNLIQSALWPIERALGEPGASPAVVEALRQSCQKLVALLTVVDDHVVRAQLAAGALPADPRPLDLVEAVEDLVLTLERLFPVPVRLVWPRRGAARPRVQADSDWLTMILRRLLLSALTSQLGARPTARGAARARPVEVRVRAAGRTAWAVEVRDAGPETAARVAAWPTGPARARRPRAGRPTRAGQRTRDGQLTREEHLTRALTLAGRLARALGGELGVAPPRAGAAAGFCLTLPRGGLD